MAQVIRRTLADQVAEQLLKRIGDTGLEPGEKLPAEGRLAEEYGVSRPVIREAMRSLQARGVTETANGKSAVVRPPDAANLQFYFEWGSRLRPSGLIELMEVRRGIEMQAASLAAERRTVEQATSLSALITAMRADLPDPDAYAELDLQLHLEIARASHNETITLLVESIRGVLRDSIIEGLKVRHPGPDTHTVQSLHEDIVERIVAKDADGAMRAMMRHFDEAVTALVREPASQAPTGRPGSG